MVASSPSRQDSQRPSAQLSGSRLEVFLFSVKERQERLVGRRKSGLTVHSGAVPAGGAA
jgi:hypothetical protein